MKKVILFTLITFLFLPTKAQNAMEAAKALRDSLQMDANYESIFRLIAPFNEGLVKEKIIQFDSLDVKSIFLRRALNTPFKNKDNYFKKLKAELVKVPIRFQGITKVDTLNAYIDTLIKLKDPLVKLSNASEIVNFINLRLIQPDSVEKKKGYLTAIKNIVESEGIKSTMKSLQDKMGLEAMIDANQLKKCPGAAAFLEKLDLNGLMRIKDVVARIDASYSNADNLVKSGLNLESLINYIDSLGYASMAGEVISYQDKKKAILNFSAFTSEIQSSFHNFEIQNITETAKGSAGLPSESAAIDAIAIFMANRVKEETVLAFVEAINKNLEKLQPLPCLFKNTIEELGNYPVDEPARFGSIFKKAVATDLAKMPDNITECNACSQDSIREIKQNTAFSNFFSDITDGVDLISNISYYSETPTYQTGINIDTSFRDALTLFRIINKYYSNLQKKDSISVSWTEPELFNKKNIETFKLSLALIYENEQQLFDSLLKYRYKCKDLDEFFANDSVFTKFTTNFKELFYRLHRFDSYWQSHRTNGKAVVDMTLYKEKIEDVFRNIYTVLNYKDYQFPTNNKYYTIYIKAKEAVKKADIESIVFYSQKLLDLMSCYEIKLPYLELPNIQFKWKNVCSDLTKKDSTFHKQLAGVSPLTEKDMKKIEHTFQSDSLMAGFMQSLLCSYETKGKWFHWRFKKKKEKFNELMKNGKVNEAIKIKFNPFLIIRCKDRKFFKALKRERIIHDKYKDTVTKELFNCYFSVQNSNQNKAIYGGARRETSKLLNFFTDISKAKGSKDLSGVISEYAEPAQSYRIKRFNNFSVDINGYPGVFAALETPQGKGNLPFAKKNITRLTTGITAPIGVSFSWGGRIKFTCENRSKYYSSINKNGNIKSYPGSCLSLTLVAIDIGAPFAYRIVNDTSAGLPREITFAQVVAPGIFVGYGIPNLPLVIKAGFQFAPQLRTFKQEVSTSKDAYRIGLSLCYDIPFLNLTNSNKRKKRLTK